jgi:hypothetical protein
MPKKTNKPGQGRKAGEKKITFGTNLPVDLYNWVKQENETTKVPVNGIIEFAVRMYKEGKEKERAQV